VRFFFVGVVVFFFVVVLLVELRVVRLAGVLVSFFAVVAVDVFAFAVGELALAVVTFAVEATLRTVAGVDDAARTCLMAVVCSSSV
jgi:hypothetical protein